MVKAEHQPEVGFLHRTALLTWQIQYSLARLLNCPSSLFVSEAITL